MKKLSLISLFSGAGGLDIGMERAGFDTVAMCEIAPKFVDTLRSNQNVLRSDGRAYFTQARILPPTDIRPLSGRDLSAGVAIDCVVGGPPCQSFSSSGKQLSVLDPRGSLVADFIRMVKEISPSAFVFENVRGIVTARDRHGKPGGVIREIYRALESTGYSCRASLLNAADYGAFQRRVRCFIIGVRTGRAPAFPFPSHAEPGGQPLLVGKPWRTLGEFLEEFCDQEPLNYVLPTPALAKELEGISDGSGLKSRGVVEPTRPGGHWGYRQGTFIADKDLPARTVTGSSSQDWVRWGGVLRRLTLLEVKRLQGFPDDWVLCGNKSDAFKQVGNAVPTVFGQIIGGLLAEHLSRAGDRGTVERIPFPKEFEGYIAYTERDHARNSSARKIHLKFERCGRTRSAGRDEPK